MADDQRGYRQERPLADIIPPDHRRLKSAALIIGGMVAGATLLALLQELKTRRAPPAVMTSRPTVTAFAAGSITDDHASLRPGGPVMPDGNPDQGFSVVVEGAAIGVVLAACDEGGRVEVTERWSTIGWDPLPPQHARARLYWQLAVFDGDTPKTDAFGALVPLPEGMHRLRLYAADDGAFRAGTWFRVFVLRPNGAIDASAPLLYMGNGPFKPPPKKVAPSEEAPASPAFDRGAAAAALAAVNVRACDARPGANGNGHVTLSFAPDGTVQHAAIDQGGNEATARGACIVAEFKKAKVPPFAGSPVRVGKTFTAGP